MLEVLVGVEVLELERSDLLLPAFIPNLHRNEFLPVLKSEGGLFKEQILSGADFGLLIRELSPEVVFVVVSVHVGGFGVLDLQSKIQSTHLSKDNIIENMNNASSLIAEPFPGRTSKTAKLWHTNATIDAL